LRFVAAGVAAAVLAVLAVDLQWVCYDAKLSDYTEYRELYRQKRWNDILQKAETTASPGLVKQFFINCALYHEGRLLDEMFHYPQAWGTRGLILNLPDRSYLGTSKNDLDREMFNSDLFFEMGNANAALMCAYDQMVVQGETYDNVRRVAECNIVRGNYPWAMKFLTMLKRTLFHRAEALRYEALLADPKARDAYFAEQRSRLPTVELPLELPGFIPVLGLLKSNPHNRMACDYLMAWCLLDRASLPMLADNVGCLRAAGYDHIPLALQEGLLALQEMSGRPLAPPGFRFDREIAARFSAFNAQMRRSPDDPAAQRRAAQAFAGTFMYYWKFIAPQPIFGYALGHFAVANEFRDLGLTADAIAHYEYALRLNPGFAEAHAALAEMLKSQGRLEEAAAQQREMRIQEKSPAPAPQTGADSAAWEPEDVP
jgi:tetratricopeptide (TPR) repeat protein